MRALSLTDFRFVCPQCREPVWSSEDSYRCERCARVYPVLFGIPDFRLRSDRYLTLQQEIAKAARLAEAAANRSFEQLVDFYYAITDDVPPELASRYKASMLSAARHMEPLARDVTIALAAKPDAVALDAGCGAGGMLIAMAGQGRRAVGVDIAMRWLVLCRKRLDELGLATPLICADLAHPPFLPETFDAVVAVDLVEHVPDVEQLLQSLGGLAKRSAFLWITAANGRTLGPHPSTRIWAIGWLPLTLRKWVLLKLRGIDSLRYTHLLSLAQLQRSAVRAGWVVSASRPRRIGFPDRQYPLFERALMLLYRQLSELPLLARLLLKIGPSFELVLRKARGL